MTAPAGGWMTPPQPNNQLGQPAPQQPPQGQPAPAPQGQPAPAGLDMNARLSGPDIPTELQGRTVGEALRYYGVMRQDFIARNRPGQPQNQPQPAYQPAPQGQPQPQPQPPRQPGGQFAPTGQPAPAQPLTADVVRQMAFEAAEAAMAPLRQVGAGSVYEQVSRQYPDWAQYDSFIQESLSTADPQAKLNPEVWRAAYFFAKGRALSHPQQAQPSNQPAPPAQPTYYDGYGRPIQPPPQSMNYPNNGQPAQPQYPPQAQQPPINQPYFIESPTPAPPSAGMNGAGVAGPNDEIMARRFGLSVDEYRAWKGGNVPQPQAPVQPPNQTWNQWNPAAPAGYQPPQQRVNNGY